MKVVRSLGAHNRVMLHYVTVPVDTPRDASLSAGERDASPIDTTRDVPISAGERDASPLLFYFIILC